MSSKRLKILERAIIAFLLLWMFGLPLLFQHVFGDFDKLGKLGDVFVALWLLLAFGLIPWASQVSSRARETAAAEALKHPAAMKQAVDSRAKTRIVTWRVRLLALAGAIVIPPALIVFFEHNGSLGFIFAVMFLLWLTCLKVLFSPHTGLTALHLAAIDGRKKEVELLLAKKADINHRDKKEGKTPLYFAAMKGHAEVVALLVANEANINAKDKDGRTPLHAAVTGGYKEVARLLLTNGADVNAGDNDGYTGLHEAANTGHREVAELLLAHKADVSAADNDGSTPLHVAAIRGQRGVAELLLASGADVDATDKDSWTPLHESTVNGHADLAGFLLTSGADVNAKEKNGHTALYVAVLKCQNDAVELLRQHGGHE